MKYLTKRNSYDVFDIFDRMLQPAYRGAHMSTDISESEKEYLFSIDMPGYNKEDISVTLENGYMMVSANRAEEKEENKDGYIYRERKSGSCSRSYYIGDVAEDSISARYDNGTLNIIVPKQEKIDSTKRIQIS